MPSGVYRRNTGIMGSPPVEKLCELCGKPYLAKAAHADRRSYCSKACQYAGRKAKACRTQKCPQCKTDFQVQPYRKVTFCSQKCASDNKRNRRRATNRGWIVNPRDGYVRMSKDGRTILQHRVVMEEALGRPLAPYENVHHINGERADNRLENLELWITKQPKGQRPADIIEWAMAYLKVHGYTVSKP
jgi:endogenous inhibitor of DNA gyrase (YacG/DUF329 family)